MTGHFLMHVDCEEGTFQDPLVLEAVVGKKKLSRKINQNSAYSFTPGIQTVPEYHTSKANKRLSVHPDPKSRDRCYKTHPTWPRHEEVGSLQV